VRRLDVDVCSRVLREVFLETLDEAGFFFVEEAETDGWFRVLGANNRRMSMLRATLLSLVGGYIPGKRTAIELVAHGKDSDIDAELRCFPYLDTLDMEAKVETHQEREMCEDMVQLFGDRLLEKLSRTT